MSDGGFTEPTDPDLDEVEIEEQDEAVPDADREVPPGDDYDVGAGSDTEGDGPGEAPRP